MHHATPVPACTLTDRATRDVSAAVEPAPPAVLHAATALRDRGWRVFPLDHPDLPRCASAHKATGGVCPEPDKRGKHPAGHWPTMAASVPADGMLATWFGHAPRNIGISCRYSGLLVLDEDTDGALEALAESLGEQPPSTYRVRTSRGWHWYLTDPAGEFGNSPGLLADWHIDVRGSKGGGGHGGYVVAAGSRHQSGAEYLAEDPWADVAPIPEWIKAQLRAVRAPVSKLRRAGDPPRGQVDAGGWNDQPRPGYTGELLGQYRRHLDGVHTRGGNFRHELYLAALDGWRLVNAGALDEFTMLSEVKEAIVRVWGADPDDNDRTIVYTEAHAKAKASPWVVIDSPDGAAGTTTDSNEDGLPDGTPSAFEIAVREEVRRQDAREEAKRRRAERDAADRPSIRSGLIDSNDLDKIPAPRMLMGEFIPHAAMGFLGGDTGTYKSFVAISWACSLAAGRPWLGRTEFAVPAPVRVLYVAAEGAAGAAQRIEAWKAENTALAPGTMVLYPRPINLTSASAVAELAEIVAEDHFGLVVIDTLHRSSPGSEDNSATEFGVVFEAMAAIRAEHDATVLFVDHSGHDGSRIRGTAAKGQDADFVVMAQRAGDNSPESQRSLAIVKRKDLATEGAWPIRLRRVAGTPSAVVEIGELGETDGSPFRGGDDWNDPMQVELPADVAGYTGRGEKAIRALARFMRHRADGGVGFTLAQARKAVRVKYVDERGRPLWSDDTIDRAWGALYDLNRLAVAEGGGATARSLWTPRPGDPE